MEDIYEKLNLIDYKELFCKPLKMPLINKLYFHKCKFIKIFNLNYQKIVFIILHYKDIIMYLISNHLLDLVLCCILKLYCIQKLP